MRKQFTPHPYQHTIISHIKRVPRCAVWASPGMGKTPSTLTALSELKKEGELVGLTLILAPLRVARTTWPTEAPRWEHLANLTVHSIVGKTPKQREKLFAKAIAEQADIMCLNYESLPWLVTHLAAIGMKWPFRCVVADESSKLKGFRFRQGTKRAKLLYDQVKDTNVCPRFIQLTGSPATQGLMDIYGPTCMMDNGERLGKTFGTFTDRYFHERQMDNYVQYTPKKGALEAAMDVVKDLCTTIRPEDYFVLDQPRMTTVYVELPDAARAMYDELETDFITAVGSVGIRAVNSAVLQGKLLQIASGALYTKPGGADWEVVHDEKLDALESIIEELGGEQLLVVYELQSDLARLKERFPKARELRTPKDEADWNRGDGTVPLLLIHPQSAGHGINLQHGGRNIAWFSHNFNLETFEQVRERLGVVRQMQSGYQRTVNEFYIVARGTVDEVAISKRDKKAITQEQIMSYAKDRNLPVLKKAA